MREYLASKGFNVAQLTTVGYGEARQVVAGAQKDDPGAEQNRRVVFVIENRPSAGVAMTASRELPR